MVFGKRIAKILELRDYKEYPELKKVPYYPVSEQKIEIVVEGVPIKAYLDLWTPETFTFGEVKTGNVHRDNGPPWTTVKVLQHDQLPFYSFLIKEKYGQVDPWVNLIWLETIYIMASERVGSRLMESESRDLKLTGRIETFKRRIAEWERKRIKNMIASVAQEISDDYTSYETNQRTN